MSTKKTIRVCYLCKVVRIDSSRQTCLTCANEMDKFVRDGKINLERKI